MKNSEEYRNRLAKESQRINPIASSSSRDEDEDEDYGDYNQKKIEKSSSTPVLDEFAVNITDMAKNNLLDPVVGRKVELRRVAQILSRKKKNNPVIIGAAGVGKSAIVEGLAQSIVSKESPESLWGKRILQLNLSEVVAGTKYRGEFEERMKTIVNETKSDKNLILFIDEIHTIVGSGGHSGSQDAAQILKPALARGEFCCIGATTLSEYHKCIEGDKALERRFQKIIIEETTESETVDILMNLKDRYENHHNVNYLPGTLELCVKLSSRYITDRAFPDKAIDIMDEVGSFARTHKSEIPEEILELKKEIELLQQRKMLAVKSQEFDLAAEYRDEEKEYSIELEDSIKAWKADVKLEVSEEDVKEVFSNMTGIPVTNITGTRGNELSTIKEKLLGRVIAQDDAVKSVALAVKRNRSGLKDPNRPIGTFLFTGPTGVGKTLLAKMLAEYVFGEKNSLIRIDMSEYQEKFTVSRLVGPPPGYVGYEEGGQLTEKVRRKPYSVVLLDEIEKAHPDVFNILLHMLEDGHMTDGLGTQIDFRNTIIIMTSNVGSRQAKEARKSMGFNPASMNQQSEDIIQKSMTKMFAPEFLNRIDEIINFNSLSKDDLMKIIEIEMSDVRARLKDLGYSIELSIEAKEFLVNFEYKAEYGARPLKRAIQKKLINPLAEMISDGLKKGPILVTINNNDLKIESKPKTESKAVKKRFLNLVKKNDNK